ncbi:anaphase-promoting complex subunit Cut9 [Pleosporales sp. CAS-2024a]
MDQYLRAWRQEASNRNQHDTAIFVADKLLALSNSDDDAYWLAQAHFRTGNYTRTQSLLARGNLVERSAPCKYLSAHCAIRLGKLDEALAMLGDKNPSWLIAAPDSARQKLRHVDVHTRAGAKHTRAGARSDRHPTSEERDREDEASLKAHAGMCYLRGLCFAKLNSFDRAKECYKTAVQIDVQCFEAFDALMANCLMSPDEEWQFLDSLDFDTINVANDASLSQEAAHFTKTLYTTRLSKYTKPDEFASATETLSTHYKLANNPDILLAKAHLMFTHCRFRDALALTSSVLEADKYNFSVMPVHLASLHELRQTNALYLLAHELADTNPQEACSWLAVGIYYLAIGRIAEARRYFSKASMMDPHFGPAWIGFAHTFAAEGEHDQAISAYSTAARLFQGTHLPQLYLGMQNLHLNNLSLAREYLNTAYALCETDPLVLNELGVVLYNELQFSEASQYFRRALDISEQNDAEPDALLSTRINLAHALRRNNQLEEALETFEEVLRHGIKDPSVFTAKGLVLMQMGREWDAVIILHEALAVSPQDPMATDLLSRAMEHSDEAMDDNGRMVELVDDGEDEELDELDRKMNAKLREIEQNRVAGRRGRRRRHAGGPEVDESILGESMMVDSDEG